MDLEPRPARPHRWAVGPWLLLDGSQALLPCAVDELGDLGDDWLDTGTGTSKKKGKKKKEKGKNKEGDAGAKRYARTGTIALPTTARNTEVLDFAQAQLLADGRAGAQGARPGSGRRGSRLSRRRRGSLAESQAQHKAIMAAACAGVDRSHNS